MTEKEFEQLISADPALAESLRNAASAIPCSRETLGTPTELASIVILFPVTVYIVKEIGLPWLYEAKRYAELWRIKFHQWIDGQYSKHGLAADAAEAAGEELRRQLEALTDTGARESWERLADLLKQTEPDR